MLAVLNIDALTEPTGLSLGWGQFTQTSLAMAMLGVVGLLLALAAGALDRRRSAQPLPDEWASPERH